MTNANVDGMRFNETWAMLKDAGCEWRWFWECNNWRLCHALPYFRFKLIFALIPLPLVWWVVGLLHCHFDDRALLLSLETLPTLSAVWSASSQKLPLSHQLPLAHLLPGHICVSKAAAINEKYADNAVGNVTAVTLWMCLWVWVFLGLLLNLLGFQRTLRGFW